MIFNTSKQWALLLTLTILWLSGYVPERILDMFGFLSIATLGILHGSNDLHLLRVISRDRRPGPRWKYPLAYVSVSLLVIAVFYLVPPAALYFFILVSAYHFGEQHYEYANVRRLWAPLLYLSYGLLVFTLLFYARYETAAPIFQEVTGTVVPRSYFGTGVGVSAVLFGLSWIGSFLGQEKLGVRWLIDAFILGLLYLVFRELSLLLGFSLYFILWHSLPSLTHQISFLKGEANWQNFRHYFSEAWPYWSVSVAGLVLMGILGSQYWDHVLTILVYFLAAITFPHVLVMSAVHRRMLTKQSD